MLKDRFVRSIQGIGADARCQYRRTVLSSNRLKMRRDPTAPLDTVNTVTFDGSPLSIEEVGDLAHRRRIAVLSDAPTFRARIQAGANCRCSMRFVTPSASWLRTALSMVTCNCC